VKRERKRIAENGHSFAGHCYDRRARNLAQLGGLGQAVVYLRVSTIDQTTANQERELRERWSHGL
jgi:hypothetical protein